MLSEDKRSTVMLEGVMVIECPNCKFSGNAPDDKVPTTGINVTCPKCKSQFTAKKESSSDFDITPNPTAAIPKTTMPCPLCGEEILAIAKKCKHCGETLDIILRAAEEAKRASNNSNVYMNAGGGASTSASVTGSAMTSNPVTDQHTSFVVKKKGKLTTTGYLLIILGLCITISGFDMAKNGIPNGMIPFGFVLMIFAYLRARNENGRD